MRVIYGELDKPDKTHILIIRGISDESIDYFKELKEFTYKKSDIDDL